ncbi:MAG: hypothetical protein M1828_003550 [Chrysothrix sp. TS-e1954]|nr:MAG: hypothetical protein M1828_003550 [Chrysothrix sp. TS-e1954]
MAVLSSLRGLDASVHIAGQPAPEFRDPDSSHHKSTETSCYIEAVSGAKFEVIVTRSRTFAKKGARIYADLTIDGIHARSGRFNGLLERELRLSDVWRSQGTTVLVHKMCFKDASTPDIDEFTLKQDRKIQEQRLKALGTIVLRLYWASFEDVPSDEPRSADPDSAFAAIKKQTIKERPDLQDGDLIASHQVNLIPTYEVPRSSLTYFSRTLKGPAFATFVFRYASSISLQLLNIIPRDPPIALPASQRPTHELTMEELRSELERKRQNRSVSIKHEARGVKRGFEQDSAGNPGEVQFLKLRKVARIEKNSNRE